MIGAVLVLAMWLTLEISVAHPIWTFIFVILGAMFMGALGLLGSIYAYKFDQMAAISNFVITPLAFLSGTFYSIKALPEMLQPIIHANPMFYIIDGGRYGVLGSVRQQPMAGLGGDLRRKHLRGWFGLVLGGDRLQAQILGVRHAVHIKPFQDCSTLVCKVMKTFIEMPLRRRRR